MNYYEIGKTVVAFFIFWIIYKLIGKSIWDAFEKLQTENTFLIILIGSILSLTGFWLLSVIYGAL